MAEYDTLLPPMRESELDALLAAERERCAAEIERLRTALKNVRPYIANCDHEPALDEIDAALKQ